MAFDRRDRGFQADESEARACLHHSLRRARGSDEPYPHWVLADIFPADVIEALIDLPFDAPDLGGRSGTRELHNSSRRFFDAEAQAAHPACRAVTEAFQSDETVGLIAARTGAKLDGCRLRVEYAQDTGAFWLKPHTDLGVKTFTLLWYLGGAGQEDLGTDLYADGATWARRYPFARNTGLVFVPSDRTWHGFEPREIVGVRKSIIVNYVTDEWRAREQLAYPDRPVRA